MFATRRFATAAPRAFASARSFQSSARFNVKVGDAIPNIELVETSPGNKVNIAKELSGKGVIVGVPAAFSMLCIPDQSILSQGIGPACSSSHVPGFINHPSLKNAGKVFVVSVNDPFVMGAWGTSLDPTGKSGIRFLADPHGELTSALDLSFDGSAIFGNARSKRYALVVEDGKVTQAHVEPDNTGLNGKLSSSNPSFTFLPHVCVSAHFRFSIQSYRNISCYHGMIENVLITPSLPSLLPSFLPPSPSRHHMPYTAARSQLWLMIDPLNKQSAQRKRFSAVLKNSKKPKPSHLRLAG
ncbi:hypothetical protein Q7P37_004941 [Cladosporium fusiforme]